MPTYKQGYTRENPPAKDAGEPRDAIIERISVDLEKSFASRNNPRNISFCAESAAETPDGTRKYSRVAAQIPIDSDLKDLLAAVGVIAIGCLVVRALSSP